MLVKSFNSTEANWNIVEKEARACYNIWYMKKFRDYLLGMQFLLQTDNWINSVYNQNENQKVTST